MEQRWQGPRCIKMEEHHFIHLEADIDYIVIALQLNMD